MASTRGSPGLRHTCASPRRMAPRRSAVGAASARPGGAAHEEMEEHAHEHGHPGGVHERPAPPHLLGDRGERGGGDERAEVREREDPRQRSSEARAPVPVMAEHHRAHEAPRTAEPDHRAGHDEPGGGGGGGVEQRPYHREQGEGADGAARTHPVEDHAHRELHHSQREEEDTVGEPEGVGGQREVTRNLGSDGGQRRAIELADRGEGGEKRDDA